MKFHLDGDEFAHLLRFGGSREEVHEILIHLSLCRECRRRLVESHPAEGPAFLRQVFPNLIRDAEAGFSRAWEEAWAAADGGSGAQAGWLGPERPSEVWARENPETTEALIRLALRLDRERVEARELWPELAPLSAAQRRLRVFNSGRFQTLGMVGVLLEHAREEWTSAPDEAETLVELALQITGELDRRAYDGMVLEDYRARGLAYLGNARRVRSDLNGAEQAFLAARAALEHGTGDVLEQAQVLDLESSLRRDQRRFEEAMERAAQAAELYRSSGDTKREAWMWVARSFIEKEAGRLEDAIATLRALVARTSHLEVGDRTYFAALQNLATNLALAGQPEQAHGYLPEIRRLAATVDEPLLTLRVTWLEGLIHDSFGEVEAAASSYRRVRDTFIARGIGYDAALVSLDLSLLYLRQGRGREARELAAEMLPIFRSRGIHREALGALRIFREALAQETASVTLGREVADYLERARRTPDLPFRPART